MKITEPEIIRNRERGMINTIQEDLGHDAVGDILREWLTVTKLASKGGKFVVHEN